MAKADLDKINEELNALDWEPPLRGCRCMGCGAYYSSRWNGTTCSVCDGDIQPLNQAAQ